MLLSAVLEQQGHQCDLLINDLERDISGQVRNSKADIIAFSITTSEYAWMRSIGNQIRRSFNGFIICGGPHPTFFPEVINDSCLDAICTGEGDDALPEFVAALAGGGDVSAVQNFSVKKNHRIIFNPVRPLREDINALPFYNRRIYRKYPLFCKGEKHLLYFNAVMTSRGCPYGCTFCFNKRYNELYAGKGKICRRRSPANVIDEIQEMRRHDRHLKFITFIDDIFTLPPGEWMTDFLEQYQETVGLPFRINTRANLLDEDLVSRLGKAGCHSIAIGVESGNESIRNKIYHKNISNQEIITAAALIKKHGIRLQTFNIVGAPEESLDMALETFTLNRRIRPDFAWCSLLNLYPGTDIFKYAAENDSRDGIFNFEEADHSYFTGRQGKMHMEKEMFHLQRLIHTGVRLRLTEKMMRLLIRLPLTGLYKMIFGAGFFLGMQKIYSPNWLVALRLSITRFSRYNN